MTNNARDFGYVFQENSRKDTKTLHNYPTIFKGPELVPIAFYCLLLHVTQKVYLHKCKLKVGLTKSIFFASLCIQAHVALVSPTWRIDLCSVGGWDAFGQRRCEGTTKNRFLGFLGFNEHTTQLLILLDSPTSFSNSSSGTIVHPGPGGLA